MLVGIGVGLLAAAGVTLVAMGMMRRSSVDLLDARLAVYEQAPLKRSLDEVDLARPLSDRLVRPVLERLGQRLARLQPGDQAQRVQELIGQAGRPLGLTPSTYIAMQVTGAVVGAGVFAGLAYVLGFPAPLGLIFGIVVGYMGPQYWLKRRATKRRKLMLLALPNALDLLTITVEAGLGFDAALARVVEKFDNPLTEEFAQVLNEIRLGRPRGEAMLDCGRRSGVEELNAFVQALVQSEQLGVGIARVLRIQSEDMRRRRRQRAEEKAQQASLKMLFPMVGCIFPTLFIVLLGPAAAVVIFHVPS
ncbi:MAG TPA: type II secretion system F family protein [Candidatus Micrarchaeia archaeon]|nr:type II secretion system F family protein [Candidatus Micrarchaeia archaeon]